MTDADILEMEVPQSVLKLCKQWASRSSIGGHSHIRSTEERQATLNEDQLVGHLGASMVCRHLFGGVRLYALSRWYADRYPTRGDGGSDLPGCNVDVKSSKVRDFQKPFATYHLVVRPAERHKNTVYIQTLVGKIPATTETWDPSETWKTWILGWANESHLPPQIEPTGIFKGAYILPAKSLNPMPPIQWAL